jgi:hypothetical protein
MQWRDWSNATKDETELVVPQNYPSAESAPQSSTTLRSSTNLIPPANAVVIILSGYICGPRDPYNPFAQLIHSI